MGAMCHVPRWILPFCTLFAQLSEFVSTLDEEMTVRRSAEYKHHPRQEVVLGSLFSYWHSATLFRLYIEPKFVFYSFMVGHITYGGEISETGRLDLKLV